VVQTKYRKRIGIVAFDVNPRSGGMGNWCWQYIQALAQLGHNVHVIAGTIGNVPLPKQVTLHVLQALASRTAFADAAARLIGRLELDFVHDMGAGWRCDVFQPHGGSHFAWLNLRESMWPKGVRWLKRPLDALLPRPRDFVRHCRRQFDAQTSSHKTFVALSNFVADDFVRFHAVRPEQIAVVPNGVDCRRFSPANRATHRDAVRRRLGIDDSTVLLLIAAHNFRLKGVPELLTVASRLAANRRPVHVAVLGGKRLAYWRRFADRTGLAGRATFVGPVTDPVPYYAAADAYVHPTYYDPCSLVLLEAAACGLPIVSTRRRNGAAELFHEDADILLVNEPNDHDALFERVDALFDSRLRDELGAASRRVALRHPFERNVAELVQLYDRPVPRQLAA
jgi:UDP-glucose:(heptosyl)LPS alpha-1,3-glucosyltransferase